MNTTNDPTPEQAQSFEDVRKLIGSLSSRTCEEAIGLSNQGGLVSGIVQATLGFAAVLIVFTAIPYWIGTNKSATASTPAAETATNDENLDAPAVTATIPGDVPEGNETDLSKAAEVLGIDETKTAPPTDNPLDKNLDNLLDGVE